MPKYLDLALDVPPRALMLRVRRRFQGSRRDSYPSLQPTFVLSTGRTGTATLAALFNLVKCIARHEPEPKLFGLSKVAYQFDNDAKVLQALTEGFRISREVFLEDAADKHLAYIETSPQVTFLARPIANLLPNARFIQLIRDPKAVIASGIRRKWFTGNANDRWRIEPRQVSDDSWASLSPLEKNAWLWTETNSWIDNFAQENPGAPFLAVKSEDLFAGKMATLNELFSFAGVDHPSPRLTRKVLAARMNEQRGGATYSADWPEHIVQRVRAICGPLANRFGYEI